MVVLFMGAVLRSGTVLMHAPTFYVYSNGLRLLYSHLLVLGKVWHSYNFSPMEQKTDKQQRMEVTSMYADFQQMYQE